MAVGQKVGTADMVSDSEHDVRGEKHGYPLLFFYSFRTVPLKRKLLLRRKCLSNVVLRQLT